MLQPTLRSLAQLSAVLWRQKKVSVSTISPLGIAFNSKLEKKVNFNLNRKNVGLLDIPELQDFSGFYLLQEAAVAEAEQLVREAAHSTRTRKLVQVFDQLSDCLCRVADMADFVRVAHPDRHYAMAADEACMKISLLVEKLNTNQNIYYALRQVIEEGDLHPTDSVDKRVAELFMFDFEQSGIHLPDDKRKKFVNLNEHILHLGQRFLENSQLPASVPRSEIPKHLQILFAGHDPVVQVSGLMSADHNDLVREAAHRVYLHEDARQEESLVNLLVARDKLAKLVGFPTYAHRAVQGTLAGSPESVMDFLETLAKELKPRADADFEAIRKLKALATQEKKAEVMPWDPIYFSGLARHQKYKINTTDLAPYLSLGCVMDGLGHLLKCLYGVKLEWEDPEYGELWSHDVHKLAVVHETEGLLGHIYCDFFERPGKPHQDCHFTIRVGREREDGTYQNPVVVLMLNLTPPRGKVPSLLNPGMMENLFHEFGHAMHSMLGRTRYQHVAGTRCPTDFAEVPSVLMEYFATDPKVMATFCQHWQTGEPLSETVINNLNSAKKMFSACDMQLQVFYSLLDQVYHSYHPIGGSTTDVLKEVQSKYYSIPHLPGTAMQLRFSHFVGYGAKYYSYLMSRAVASKMWHECFQQDPFNRAMGEAFRYKVLSHGGQKPPAELVEDFLNEKPTTDTLVQALLDDLDN